MKIPAYNTIAGPEWDRNVYSYIGGYSPTLLPHVNPSLQGDGAPLGLVVFWKTVSPCPSATNTDQEDKNIQMDNPIWCLA